MRGLWVAEIALVSPLGLSPSEHVFFARAEVSPHASGAFTDAEGESLPIHDCPWIPASRPWASRVRLLARQALARARPSAKQTPVLLVTSAEAANDAEIEPFVRAGGARVEACHLGSAAYVSALQRAQELLETEDEVVVLAVDSLLSRPVLERWARQRHSTFTRNPLPPSEGAAAMRLVRARRGPLVGKIHAFAAAASAATDENDTPADGVALSRAFAELGLPPRVDLVVGPRDLDTLRTRDFHLAALRHHAAIDGAEMPRFEGRIGLFGSAAGLMDAVFVLASLRHGPAASAPGARRLGLAWARSAGGLVGASLLGDERS